MTAAHLPRRRGRGQHQIVISAAVLVLGMMLAGAEPLVATSSGAALVFPGADTSSAPELRPPSAIHAHRPHWPAWLGAGSAIVCLGLGVYYRAVAHEAAVEAERTTDMDTYTRDIDDAHASRVLATGLFIVSAVSLAGALVYYLWPSDQD